MMLCKLNGVDDKKKNKCYTAKEYNTYFYMKQKGRIKMFSIVGIIVSLIVGAIAGTIAGKIMKSEGSMLRNVILGIIGGVVGSILLGLVGINGSGFIGSIIVSVIGACIVIAVVNAVMK